jgi:hypothetical protein
MNKFRISPTRISERREASGYSFGIICVLGIGCNENDGRKILAT